MSTEPGLIRVPAAPPADPEVLTLSIQGYPATHTDEGLVIHGVPIFCACARGDMQFDELWVKAAVAKAMQREREGYLAPLHIRHHESKTVATDTVRPAGYFRVTGTGPVTLGGARRTAVLADLIFTDPCAAHEAINLRLPYRSVEIFDVNASPSIDGLALLDHEAPYLELPMLKVGDVVEARTDVGALGGVAHATFQNPGPTPQPLSVVAFSHRGNAVNLTFRAEEPMGTQTQEAPTDGKAEVQDASTDERKNFADDGPPEKDEKDGEDMEGDVMDVMPIVKAIESGEISIADMDLILAAIQSQGASDEPEVVDEPAAAPAPDAMKADTTHAATFAKMQGKIDALEARNATRDASDTKAKDVREAMDRLRGLPLGSGIETKLGNFHAAHGGAAFNDYVESLATNVAVDPGADETTIARFQGQGGKLAEGAQEYEKHGTDAVEKAANFSRQFDQLKGSGIRSSREAYIAANMAKILSA